MEGFQRFHASREYRAHTLASARRLRMALVAASFWPKKTYQQVVPLVGKHCSSLCRNAGKHQGNGVSFGRRRYLAAEFVSSSIVAISFHFTVSCLEVVVSARQHGKRAQKLVEWWPPFIPRSRGFLLGSRAALFARGAHPRRRGHFGRDSAYAFFFQ